MTFSVLVCDAGHQPHHWTTKEDGIVLKVKNLIAYEMGDPATFRGGVSRMTGERSQIDVAPIIFLKNVLKYDSRTPPLTNKNLFARDRHICAFCGRHYPEHKLSREHIIPSSRGGPNNWKNCISACKACNHAKADMTLEEAGMELVFIPYVPNTAEKLLMQNRRILADQAEFLKAMLPEHSRLLGEQFPTYTM